METEEEQHMTTLLCMGFPDAVAIRKALRMAKNDINEAVALLTNESPGLGYGYEPMESGPGPSGDGESSGRSGSGSGGFDPPPAYHDVVEGEKNSDENGNCSGGNVEFPTTNLYELESRVFTDHWSIPYKREESLGKCLIASTCLAKLSLADADENCKRFIDRCMPEAFKKLLTSSAVHKWGTEIHEGIYNMLMLLVDLVAERVKLEPIPVGLLGVLTMAFNPDNEYHFKNRMKVCQRNWSEVFGEGSMFAVSLSSSFQKFGELGGFAAIQSKLGSEEIEIGCVSALVQPLGVCAEYLNSSLVQPMLDPVIHKMITYVQNVEEKDLKDKRLVSIPELLSAIKLLCMRFQPDLVTVVDDLRLDILLRMLKTPHFSAKMNSLKEVTKLIEDSTVSKTVKNAIDTDKLLDWLVENSVLSIALEGNIDQAQYCDRIKGIIELLGSKLSLDELSKIWRIQAGQSSTVIENIHTIIAAAAVKFNFDQLSHLFVLIQKSWEMESDRVRQKLLSLIGRIGREARSEATTGKVLEVLWELAHLPTLPTSLVQQALEEHLAILSDAYAVKEAVKRNYIIKCIEDIKKILIQEETKTPMETQVSFLTGSWGKKKPGSISKQSIIQDLKKNFEIVKLITGSLVSCHRLAVSAAGPGGLSGSTLVDGRYTYQEYLEAHLRFMAFFLQEASLYLVWNRAKDIWECLVSGMDICDLDREMCFEWFTKGQHDLESDVQQQLFKEKILKLEPYEITMNGFNLFKTFFESVNLSDHRLKKQGTQLFVERLDLAGMDFIWRIAMESPDEEIANEAIQLIITYSYINLNPKMRKDSVSLHKKFIADCYKRLETASSALGGPTLTHAVTRATKMLTATAMPTVATSVQSPSRSTKIIIIERLLLLAERYVLTIEDLYSVPRTILPHGASFHGHPVTLHVTYESTKDTFTLEAHSNETVGSVRWKIAEQLNSPVDNVQIFANDSVLTMNKDQKLLNQLGFSDEQGLTVKTSGTGTPSGSSADSSASASSSSSSVFNSAYALEQEKSLPGVVMALVCNVFEMLYQLANLDEPRITLRVRKLLLLIPTDPEVLDALDNFVPKESSVWSHQKTLFTVASGSQASKSPSLSSKQQHQQSASSILESLFRSSAPGMSTFRVLYNLEVLSSKLMPTTDDEMAKTSVKSFCENFLKAGGLSLVVNVMQRDSIPSEVDYETRQGVYSICLQLARFLLVGQAMPSSLDEVISKDGVDALFSRPFRNTSRQNSRQLSFGGTPEKSSYRQMSLSDRSSIRVEEIIPAARVAIQTMEVNDFTSTVACIQEKSLPGVVMALVCNVFEMLYQLANLDEPRITLRVRKLLLLIPTDPEVQDALDNFVPKESSVWSHQKTLFTVASGSQASKSPSLSSKQQHQQSASSILESLFRSSAPGMSTFRVLYNLEVLSSKLMPTTDDEMAKTSVKSFCENFLKAGGLSLVVNVMQRDSIPSEVDYETRQGVYSICLQLARFLLVGQAMPSSLDEVISKDGVDALFSRPFRNTSRQNSRQLSFGGTPEKSSYRQMSMSDRSSIRVEEIIPAARVAIQTMEVNDFTSTVACFMRLTWAAAAGRLDLVGSSQPIRESTNSLFPLGVRNRLSSTGSNCSSGSEGEPTTLHAGICVKQNCVSIKDTIIAREALSLLVTCLQLRCQQLGCFYNLPCVSDFIIDILLGSPSGEIRSVACDQLYTLSQTDTSAYPDLHKPNLFLLRVVLTAQLPLWSPTSIMRGINQRLLSQCAEYFDLRCQLLDDLTSTEMEQLQISPAAMLEDEINWLDNFEPTWTAELETSEADNILQAGHLRLIKTLLSLCGNDKEQLGPSLIQQLLDDFLFRASRIILNSNNPTGSSSISQQDFHPKCSTVSSRLAAYEVLVMLADSSLGNLQLITRELLSMHHQADPALTKEFDYLPPVDSRSSSGFVGLKNGGATCYMNAVFQQLYMQPGLAEAFLTIEEDTENPEESVFYQVQSLFGHLMESKLQYYVPENFWKIFKMWNKELFVREQQDAYEFFTSLVDQLDEHLKKINREQIFKNTFQGIFSDQKICKDCPHRYEREETFMALNLGVTSCQSLEISLDQFVRGEVLEGSNAYYCEKCKEKRTTVKRTCIKSLPSVLVIHLMRFGFDWESGRSIKYDEQIKFPWVLNMEPYTVSGMARQDSTSEHGENGRGGEQGGSPRKKVTISENYELVGVVVHSGQAHAGHYYSFIKDRRGSAKGKWYKFNDNVVEEFDMNDETLEYECFGGEYRPKVYDQSNPYPDVRRRYWNAYMLFYQRISDQNSPVLPKKSRVSVMRQEAEDLTLSAPSSPEVSPQSSPRPPRANNDRLSLLTKLVRKGEKKGLFVEKMPARIYQMVRDENLKFMKNRDVYNSDYFNFTLSLASVNATKLKHPAYQAMAKVSLQLAIQFLFHTYLRTKKKLRICLLESSVREVRIVVATILEKTLESALHYQDKGLDQLLEVLLSLLDKDVPENCKNCSQYFYLFSNFVQRGHKSCQLLLQHSAYMRMLIFLLGPNRQNNQNRRWSSAQAREFLHLHNTLALMVLHTDASGQRTVAPGQYKQSPPVSISMPGPLLALHGDIETLLFKPEGQPYLLEVMFAMRELSGPLSFLLEMITSCCFCNEPFSLGVLQLLKHQLETAPPHELKNIFQLLLEILVVEDPLQTQRLKYAFESDKGLLALMHQSNNVDSSRCYQCVKFLVTLAQKCSPAKDYFKENSNHWSWAVQWLQKKMSEHYWTPQSNVSNETSTAKTFQRTISAQDTLAYATALLNEKEQSGSSNGSEESPANDNSDRSLRQLRCLVCNANLELYPDQGLRVSDDTRGFKK
ncbi:UNVERIFIED_CONTAM: hypothetical protein FKN15_073043 [Acipenser sinensis]